MKATLYILTFDVFTVASEFSAGDDNSAALPDLALQPPSVQTEFSSDQVKSSRGAQDVPAIERSALGRLLAAWYACKPVTDELRLHQVVTQLQYTNDTSGTPRK